MRELSITKAFLKNYNVFWDGNPLDSYVLANSKALLPVIFVALDKAVNDPTRLATMLSYGIEVNKEAVCFIEAINVNVLDEDKIINEIKQFGGIDAVINHLYLLEDSDGLDIDVAKYCSLIREHFAGAKNGKKIAIKDDFDFLTLGTVKKNENTSLPDAIEMVSDLDERLATAGYSAKPDESDSQDPLADAARNFVLERSYAAMDDMGKALIEEIAVVATADYLSKHSGKSIEELVKAADVELKVDEITVLAAIQNQSVIMQSTADYFFCQPYQIVFSETVYDLRAKLFRFSESRSFGDPSSTWYQYAKKNVSKLKLSPFLRRCLVGSLVANRFDSQKFVELFLLMDSSEIKDMIGQNKIRNNLVYRAKSSQLIERQLNKRVVGQESAIASLCEGYLTSSINASTGPRTIYTFVGPSGVGKTYLASQLLADLNQQEKTGYDFTVFNMEHYADQRDASKLFGSGIQYVDASLGMLTHVVRAQPRQILLFDEIEKAHSTVIQSLLSILDSGVAKDQTSQEEVDFSQCIVIFTTNLGQDVISSNSENYLISVFDILRNSENPANKNRLSPEFVNRLAKGYPIVFNELKINHLLRLAESELTGKSTPDPQVQFLWSDDFASFMLKSMAPDISVRALKGEVAKIQSEVLSKATPLFDQVSHEKIVFNIEVEKETETEQTPLTKLLLLDNDSRVYDQLSRTDANSELFLCDSRDSIQLAIEEHLPDALLVDLDTIDNLPHFLEEELGEQSKLPIFSYRIVTFDSVDSSVSSVHDVREHFNIESRLFEKSFQGMVARVQYYLSSERTLSNMMRRREALSYHCTVLPTEAGFSVSFGRQTVKQVVQSHDLRASELFKMSLPKVKLDDVIGLERAKKRMVDVIGWLKAPEKLNHFGVSVPSGFLFSGPSGTGKTLLAKAVAGESGLPFFAVSASELSSSNSGGTTENIKKLFATARKYAPSMIFIDEIDAIAARRSNSNQGADRDRNLTVNALLIEMDGFVSGTDAVFVMAATNHPELLDRALVRPGRFDETILCDLPNRHARQCFFNKFSQKHNIKLNDRDFINLVSSSRGMSSAQIDQVFREAIYQSVSEGKLLSVEALKKTMVRVSYGSPNEHIVLGEKEKKRTAYHEAGHLLVTSLLFPNQAIDFVTIEPRDQALGFLATRAEEEYESYSSVRIHNSLEVLIAGRVAEKLFSEGHQEVSTGASNDIKKATQLAMHAVYEGGLESSIGPVDVAMLTKFEESDLLIAAQKAVQKWIINAETSVEKRLTAHRDALDTIANTLYEKESLLADEVEQLLVDTVGSSKLFYGTSDS